KANKVIKKLQLQLSSPDFTVDFDLADDKCQQVRVYAWDSEQNIDAMAGFSCVKPIDEKTRAMMERKEQEQKRAKNKK
ncbi:hypothetical protein MNBD_GAMMA01-1016, partial [hydrothermal vent metagenome]